MSSRGVLSPGRRGAPRAAVTGACGDPARRARDRGTSRYNLRCRKPMPPPLGAPTAADWQCRADVAAACAACPLRLAQPILQRQLCDWDSQPVSPALVRHLLGAGCALSDALSDRLKILRIRAGTNLADGNLSPQPLLDCSIADDTKDSSNPPKNAALQWRNRFLLCGAPHRLVSIMPQVFRIPPVASRQCSSTVSRELVGTIGSSDKDKDKNNWNKYEDGHKDKYKQELAQQHERPRVQPSSFILVSLKRRCPLKRNRRSRRESTRMGEMVNLELLFKNTHRHGRKMAAVVCRADRGETCSFLLQRLRAWNKFRFPGLSSHCRDDQYHRSAQHSAVSNNEHSISRSKCLPKCSRTDTCCRKLACRCTMTCSNRRRRKRRTLEVDPQRHPHSTRRGTQKALSLRVNH